MTGKIKRRSLRCGGRPKADFGSLFTSVMAPALNAAGSIADESIDNNKTATNGVVNNNTTIPSDPTKTPTMRLGGRKKCWIGAAIGAATSIAGSLFGNGAKKREMRRQQSIQDWQNATQEAANMTSVLNNSRDYQEDYLRQFRTAARLGKTLGAKGIYITDGGDATKIGNNTYLLRGGSHEDVNETGQTGIGINVGGNEVEAEGGEVAQKKNGALRIFSAQPILGNGMSPAQAVMNGANKDKVFNAQQQFKRRNHLSDSGNTYKNGGTSNKPRFRRVKNYGVTDTTPYPNDEDKPNISTTRLNPFERLAKFASTNLMELGRTGLLDTEGLNVAQDSYLVPTRAIQAKMFADAGYTRDYNSEKNRDYGLVKKGVGNRNIPIYSRTNPNFGKQRKDLVVLGNSYNMNNVDKALVHAGSYPSAIYSDNEGNIYINSWDLNDYGVDAAGNTGDLNDHYGSFRKKLAKSVDVIGNPTVVTTGYQRALDNNKPIKISNYNDYYNLSNNGYTEAIKESLDNWMEKQGVELNEVGYGSPLVEIVGKRKHRLGGRCKLRNGGLTSKDRGSSKHPYPSVSSKDFAGGGRSYPIPTKADAVDALRLAGLHGRSDVRSKVYSKYPELRKKARNGIWIKPVYNTSKYRGTIRARRQIAKWEGSDFAGQNAQFKGDAIGAKERELRQFMGKAYNYLNDNQRDALLSYYYNLVPKTFKGQMTKYRNDLINAQTEQEYNDTLNNMRESINVGANRKGMRGLRNRRAIERNWFGYNYSNPIQEKVDKTLTQVPDATKVVQPIMQQSVITKPIEINTQEGYVPNDNPQGYNIPQGRLYNFIKGNMKRQLRYGGSSRPVKGVRPKAELGWLGYPYPLPRKWDFTNINLGNYKPSILSKNYPYARGMDNKARQLENSDNYRDFSLYRTQLDETNPYVQALTKATGHSWNDIKDNNYNLRYDHKLGYNHFTPEVKEDKYGIWGEPIEQKTWLDNDNTEIKSPYNPQKVINSSINTKNTIPVDTKKTTEYDIRDNKFGMTPSTGDWIGLGIDTLTGLAGGIVNYNAAKDMYIPGRAPIMLASKLPTNYNITPQLEEVKRYRDKLIGQTYNNTSSSVAALNRAGTINLNSLNELSKLWTTKENEENKMLTQDAFNQQSVAETNIRNQIARESEIAKYRNAQSQAKYDAINASLTGLAQAYNNFYTNATKRYEDEIAMRTYLAGSEAATPYRMLSMGVPMSTRSRIGLLNQVGNITNPGPRPERKDYDSNASWSRAIDKWEKDNTLYKQRGQYKNMILRGISSKAKRKYGIG